MLLFASFAVGLATVTHAIHDLQIEQQYGYHNGSKCCVPKELEDFLKGHHHCDAINTADSSHSTLFPDVSGAGPEQPVESFSFFDAVVADARCVEVTFA